MRRPTRTFRREPSDGANDLTNPARFPGARVVRGDALMLERNQVGTVKAVVSSLPLLNLSERERRAVLSQATAALKPGGVLVQYTYGPAEPVSSRLRA